MSQTYSAAQIKYRRKELQLEKCFVAQRFVLAIIVLTSLFTWAYTFENYTAYVLIAITYMELIVTSYVFIQMISLVRKHHQVQYKKHKRQMVSYYIALML